MKLKSLNIIINKIKIIIYKCILLFNCTPLNSFKQTDRDKIVFYL